MVIKVEEKTLQLALVKAAGQLGVTQDELSYQILSESSGFFGMFGKKIAVQVWKKQGQQRRSGAKAHSGRAAKQAPAPLEPKVEAKEFTQAELAELKESLRSFCAGICSHMVGEEVRVDAELDDERLILDIHHEFLAEQMNKNSRFAEALEHILRKKPRHIRQELPFRIFIDVNGSRQSRESELVDMAQDLSNKVHENRRPIVLNYRSSYDRKIIHMALDKDDRVYTKSIGSGPNRKLMILPVKDSQPEASVR